MRVRSAFIAARLGFSRGEFPACTDYQIAARCWPLLFHTCSPLAVDSKAVKKGKERQAAASSQLAEILPQNPTPPHRTAEELEHAESRAKEYSRQRMRELREHQTMQKARTRMRNNALVALPPELRMAALQPVYGEWPLKMLPPFASPPRAPKWRM